MEGYKIAPAGAKVNAARRPPVAMPLTRAFASAVALARGVFGRLVGRSPEHYRLLVEKTPDLVLTTTRDGRILSANEAATLFTGDGLLVGKSLLERAPEEDRAAFAEQIAAAFDGESRQVEQQLAGAGGTMGWFLCGCNPLRDDHGTVGREVLVVARDVTARKQDEQAVRRTEERVRQAHKMDALGRLAAGIAHDFNNLLTIINSYSQFLAKGIEKGTARKEDVEEIRAAVKRAAELTNRLLAFGRRQPGAQERVIDLNTSVRGVEPMVRRLIDERIKIETQLSGDGRWVKADPAQIDQVLMILAVNARDAMPEGGRLTFETAEVSAEQALARAVPGLRPGYHVVLTVADTGVGMDDATKSHLYEPFFTTKRPGEGTGLGLATVYSIVHQCGGYIDVESAPGAGTRFRIYLPAESAPTAAPVIQHRPSMPVAAVGGVETVLLVEDNQPLRELVQVILKGAGYTVLVAAHGGEALELSKHHRGPIHLLVSDLVMPEVGGRELATKLWETRSDLRVLFMSGYMGDDVMRQAPHGPGIGFIGKPFMPEDFIRKVRECCDGPAPTVATLPSSLDGPRAVKK
jgi:two-component system, cell cycle sensor histidine kinase and response regulator CckA